MIRNHTKTVRTALAILTAVLMITSVVAPAAGYSLSANPASTTVDPGDTSAVGETGDTTSETVEPADHDIDDRDRVNVTGSLGDGSSAGVKTVFAVVSERGDELPPEGPGGEDVAQTLTDADGNFTLKVPSNGTYDIVYRQGNFRATQNQANLIPRDGVPDMFAIDRVTVGESDVSLGDQAPPAGHDLNVSVVDESGNPVQGALVTYVHTENDPDDPARASLPGLPTNVNGLADVSNFPNTARGVAGLEVAGNVTVLVAPPVGDDQPEDPTHTRTLNVTEDDQINVTLNQTGTPTIMEPTAIDREDDDGIVSEGDRVEVRATVTDADDDVDRVGAIPGPFGVGEVELTSAGGDLYNGTFVVESDYSTNDGSYPIQIVAEDGAGNFASVFTEPLEVNGSDEEPVDNGTPPTITDPTAIDLEDDDGVVSEGDRVEVRATVTDADGDLDEVFAVLEPFGVERVELTSAGGDLYNGTFVVGSEYSPGDGSFDIPIVAKDDAENFADVLTEPLEVNGSDEEPVDNGTPPTITNATAIDREDGDGVVSEGDRVEVRATVTDADGDLDEVFAVPEPFGVERVELTSAEGDLYTGTFVVGSNYLPGDGRFPIPIVAEDNARNFADVETEPLEVNGSDEEPVDNGTPPTITDATAIDSEDDDGVVSDGDLVEIRATVTDEDSGIDRVFAFPRAFGVERVELTSAGDNVYRGTFRVDARDAVPEGSYSIGVVAEDEAGNDAEAESNPLELTLNETDRGDTSELASSVQLAPRSATIGGSGSTTFDVVVEDADSGVGAHTTTVTLEDSSVAEITDVELAGDPGSEDVDISGDNSSVNISAALMDTDDTGAVTIATITVEGNSSGETAVNLDVSALGNETGTPYQVTDVDGAMLTVTAAPTIGPFDNPANDPDGDGIHEDMNGDGEVNVVDVQAMFANRDDTALKQNPQLFDINDDGEVNVVDVQALFVELTQN